jgi:hypothetical protein
MSDVAVTVPCRIWKEWIAEGGLPGEAVPMDVHFYYTVPTYPKRIRPGERVYVVSCGKLRGYSPLLSIHIGRDPELGETLHPFIALVRQGGAVAVTIPEPIKGFQGYRYRWWDRSLEVPFPDWRTP